MGRPPDSCWNALLLANMHKMKSHANYRSVSTIYNKNIIEELLTISILTQRNCEFMNANKKFEKSVSKQMIIYYFHSNNIL